MINQDSLMADLARMGLSGSDTVLLHTSYKRIGPVEGGPDAVLDALSAYFAPGLLCFPTLSWETLQAQPPRYDVRNTPSIVGILPERFRKRKGVVRSWNPTHSVSALGEDAQVFTADDHLDGTPCGPQSSWHKLVQRDAYILMVGCDLTTCTFLHGVEEWCDIPNRIAQPVAVELILPDGSTRQIQAASHSAQPSVNYWKVEAGLRKAGLLKDGTFGQAATLILRARDLYAYTAGCLSMNPTLFD